MRSKNIATQPPHKIAQQPIPSKRLFAVFVSIHSIIYSLLKTWGAGLLVQQFWIQIDQLMGPFSSLQELKTKLVQLEKQMLQSRRDFSQQSHLASEHTSTIKATAKIYILQSAILFLFYGLINYLLHDEAKLLSLQYFAELITKLIIDILIIIIMTNSPQDFNLQSPQQPLQHQPLLGLYYNLANLGKDKKTTRFCENQIRKAYIIPELKPYYFCSYESFAKAFPAPNIYEAYKSQNLNIIQLHLRYDQYIHEKLAIFKWLPSLVIAVGSKFHPLSLLSPLFFCKFVDHYFKDFFTWKYSKDKIINIRSEFSTKLSKQKNFIRRITLFDKLKDDFATKQFQIPLKYIKFGEHTHYIFHTTIKNIEQSSIYLTPFFQNVMNIKSVNKNSAKDFRDYVKDLTSSFKIFKNMENKKQLPIFINRKALLTYKDIKEEQIYNLSKQIQLRIRRFLEVAMYLKTGEIYMSGFTMKDALHLNKHFDLLSPEKYNLESDAPDLVLFYGSVLTFKLAKFIIKRAVKM